MKFRILTLALIFTLPLVGCNNSSDDGTTVELITVEEMDSLLKLGEVKLIDVRTPQEFAQGHIESAINIDFRNENFEELIAKVDKTKPVAVYCGKGGRSGKCSSFMKKAGFTKIYDLDGGITEWKFNGKKVVK
ncbi:rhodanese-like domain-containing protein [Aquimarina spongiae]|uniref:Rhodanese-related sulfurtransferase n=1 Tax=Aquimarina spongiae TaxID=570521 RepID=A0A1M6HNF7_9FLAO|nr:rhodanese-like domain-containing protein [Aquimarina spongiae]SHJ23737.1 Rhodanese-related sulfurtransferase [Aquimarina spongiae]